MEKEIKSQSENRTWGECALPDGRKAIDTRWVFTRKYDAKGMMKLKARLVVKGFYQIEGIDFSETYAPVAPIEAIRLFLALAVDRGHTIHHTDMTTAFLHAPLDEE